MSKNQDLSSYLNNVNMPWGKLFYQLAWAQLPKFKELDILDFGSGFGITANHLAADNNVTAYEPDTDMPTMYSHNNKFIQTDVIPDKKFDVIICHNVLEYVPDRVEIIRKFHDLIKPDGVISIIKHNHIGRIMQKVIFECNIDEAMSLLNGGESYAANFGKINYYDTAEFSPLFNVEKRMGIRTFYALQNNEVKSNSDWQGKMFELELKVSEITEFVNVAFFNHVLLTRS
jgi:2-polyprenyl-3-methyl-5-hydroxy-6-metoxy-1,4-benzoquinol methylase